MQVVLARALNLILALKIRTYALGESAETSAQHPYKNKPDAIVSRVGRRHLLWLDLLEVFCVASALRLMG